MEKHVSHHSSLSDGPSFFFVYGNTVCCSLVCYLDSLRCVSYRNLLAKYGCCHEQFVEHIGLSSLLGMFCEQAYTHFSNIKNKFFLQTFRLDCIL